MWVAEFYFQMYQATGDKQFAVDGYETLQSMFRQFGYGFYAIGIPVQIGLESLEMAGMKKEYIRSCWLILRKRVSVYPQRTELS